MKDTKDQILKAAYDILLTGSYESLTFSSIGKATGLTKGAVYHHFSSKEALFVAVIDKYIMNSSKSIGDKDYSSLAEMIEDTISFVKQEVSVENLKNANFDKSLPLQYISINLEAFRHYPDYDKVGYSYYTKEAEKWKRVLDDAVLSGEIRSDIDTEVVASSFMIHGTGLLANMILQDSLDFVVELYERQMKELYKVIKK